MRESKGLALKPFALGDCPGVLARRSRHLGSCLVGMGHSTNPSRSLGWGGSRFTTTQ